MKNNLKYSFVIVIVFILIGCDLFIDVDLEITNRTGYTIWYVQLAQEFDDTWGSDYLGSNDVLYDGDSIIVSLEAGYLFYDIKLTSSEGYVFIKEGVSRSEGSVTFTTSDVSY